jgi:hypothetical protein
LARDVNRLRPITIVGLFQVLTVVVGILAARIILKMSGYPDDTSVRWNAASVFLRNYGIALLLVPLIWTPLTVAIERKSDHPFAASLLSLSGPALLIGLLLFCSWACTHCYTRPLLFLY